MDFEESKKESYTYAIIGQAAVELNNQYGEVQVVEWDKDSVKLEATITARSSRMEDIQKLMDMIEVVARGTESNVVISTDWATGAGLLRRSSMDIKNFFNAEKRLTVDYVVYMPSRCRLNISNRFGDVYLPNYAGPLRVELAHGDLRAREIKDARRIAVKYGKVLIKKVEKGFVKLEYGSLILDMAGSITLESKSSTVEIIQAERLAIKSRNDEFRIDKVESLRGDATYTYLRAKNIASVVDITTTYGDVSLKEIHPGFNLVRINGTNTDYDLEFAQETSYRFEVDFIGSKTFSYPQKASITSEEVIDNNNTVYKGYINQKESTSFIEIQLKNGYLTFSHLL
jgi:hypothetical protein